MKDLSYSKTVYIQIKKLPLRLKQLATILNPKQFTKVENYDLKLATLFVVVSLVLLAVASIAIQSLLLQQISGTVLLSSGIYLLLHRRRRTRPEEGIAEASSISPIPQLNPSIGKILDISFWGLFIASITIISQNAYARPLSFLILVSVMCSILAVEIVTKKSTAYCLVKILILGILLRGSVWYQFPTAIGTDPFIEINYLKQLVATGHVGNFLGAYIYYPLGYTLGASIWNITGLSLGSSFFVLSVISVISLVFVFLIGRDLFNREIGLLAALIMVVFDWHVFWGFYIKSMTFAIALVPIILWLLLAMLRNEGRLHFPIIAMLMTAMVIFTHTYVNAALAVILGLGLISIIIIKRTLGKEGFEGPVRLYMLLLFAVATLGYWIYASGFIYYIDQVVTYAMSIDTLTIDQAGLSQHILPRAATLLTWEKLPTLVLVFFAFLGFFSILNFRKPDQRKFLQIWLALVGGMLLTFNFILFYMPPLGILETARWHLFTGLLLACVAAVGLLSILSRRGWQSLLGLSLSVLLLSGLFTTSHISNITSVVPWKDRIRMAYTTSEMSAADTISQMAGLTPAQDSEEAGKIYTDFYYLHPLWYQLNLPRAKVVDGSSIFLGESENVDGIIILRRALTTEVVGATYPGYGRDEFKMDSAQYQSFVDDTQYSLIYDCGTVKAVNPR